LDQPPLRASQSAATPVAPSVAPPPLAPPARGGPVPPPPLPPTLGSALDHVAHAQIAELSGGFSPMALALATYDWAVHLSVSPGRQTDLALSALARFVALMRSAGASAWKTEASRGEKPQRAQDRRFRAADWSQQPFSLYADALLAAGHWWDEATSNIHGAEPHHLAMVNFVGRQALDTVAPSNFLWTNPVALKKTFDEGGVNLVNGALNYAADVGRVLRSERSEAQKAFKPGETVALTPGVVIKRTPLAEIIQYNPTTQTVRPEPVVIVPAWINKFYILDLRPENSLIRYLVGSGFTVFCISWRNPTAADREIGFSDYQSQGVKPAIDAALAITGAEKAHLVGYCIGGTLTAITAASMAREKDDRLKTLTLIAAQTDFEEAGELRLFIDHSQLAVLDDMMWERGALEGSQMQGTFSLLRSNDLIWSKIIHHYLMGEPERVEDLDAWSSDNTRMPYKMHSQYLRELYLDNDLAEGRFRLDGRLIALQDIRVPIFVIGAESDTVAPWRSVFKIHLHADSEITFALVSGGHNQGVVCPPIQRKFVPHCRIGKTAPTDPRPDPDVWAAAASYREGSWWPAWFDWLGAHSAGMAAPPPLGAPEAGLAPLEPAPGEYVRY